MLGCPLPKRKFAENDLSSPKQITTQWRLLSGATLQTQRLVVYWSLFQWTLQNVGVEACCTVALYPIFSMSI